MKIGINLTFGTKSKILENYFQNLFPFLLNALSRIHQDQIILYLQQNTGQNFLKNQNIPFNIQKKILSFKNQKKLRKMSLEILKNPVDCFLSFDPLLPFFIPQKSIIILDEFTFKFIQEIHTVKEYFSYDFWIERSIKKSSKIIVFNEITKSELIKIYKCPKEKIIVIPPGKEKKEDFGYETSWEVEAEKVFQVMVEMVEKP